VRALPAVPAVRFNWPISRIAFLDHQPRALDLGARLCLSKPVPDLAVFEQTLRAMLHLETL
jgi:hypothetical protein